MRDTLARVALREMGLLREAGGRPEKEIKAREKPSEDQPRAGQTTGGVSPSSQGDRKASTPLYRLNQDALTPPNLKLWVPELFPAATLHESTGAWRVTSDDLGRSLEEDLSIAPAGIRDFGEETSQTPVGLVIEYGEVAGIVGEDEDEKGKAAAKWLAETIGKAGGTPLAVAKDGRLLGVVALKDIVKGGIRERFAELRRMGIRTVMITGDNPMTAAAIAAEAAYVPSGMPVVLTGIGKTLAAVQVTRALAEPPPRDEVEVVNIGTAGALRPDVTGLHEVFVIHPDTDALPVAAGTGTAP